MWQKWWIIPLLLLCMTIAFIAQYHKTGIFTIVLLIGYIAFRFLQVYAVTLVEENKIIFQRFSYQITSKCIIMQLTNKQGMNIAWEQIQKVKQKPKSYTLFLGPVQFIHLPKRIFQNPQAIKFFEMLLKRKKLVT